MKTLPPALAEHLAGGATTLCHCWRLQRADGTVLGFTDHDRTVSFGGTDYEAAAGFTASEMQASLGLAVDNLDVEGALQSARIEEADIRAGAYDDAAVEIWRVNWAAPGQRVLLRRGNVGEIRRGDSAFVAEVRGLAHRLDQAVGRVYGRPCDAQLGDARCKVGLDAPAFRAQGSVATVSGRATFAAAGLGGHASGWFAGGRLEWTAGANAGRGGEVKAHVARSGLVAVTLWEPPSRPLAAGDAFTVRAGCDKSLATCRDKFANTANHRGFPHMPGNDFVFSYAAPDGDGHDGGSFFG